MNLKFSWTEQTLLQVRPPIHVRSMRLLPVSPPQNEPRCNPKIQEISSNDSKAVTSLQWVYCKLQTSKCLVLEEHSLSKFDNTRALKYTHRMSCSSEYFKSTLPSSRVLVRAGGRMLYPFHIMFVLGG
jgi:hypothetical protein